METYIYIYILFLWCEPLELRRHDYRVIVAEKHAAKEPWPLSQLSSLRAQMRNKAQYMLN